jgi:hypothetical protein
MKILYFQSPDTLKTFDSALAQRRVKHIKTRPGLTARKTTF